MERYKAIFGCFPDIFILTDVLGTIIDINRAPQGYRKEDVIGTDFKDFHNNDQMILFEKAVEETIQSNRPSSYEVSITNPKGTVLYWKNNISVLKTKGIPTMLIINCRVLKEQKKVEEQFGISDEIYKTLINNASTIDFNVDMQTKLDELSRTNNDMKNLLDSTDIATLFLDNSLSVRRFTSETSKITK
ncbi:MAG: PAS domain S-box protein, partial [Thermoplasmatota archaeon]